MLHQTAQVEAITTNDEDDENIIEAELRYSSNDVIVAADKMNFNKKDASKQLKQYCTNAQNKDIDELCKEFEVHVEEGLNYKQVDQRRQEFGANVISPPPKSTQQTFFNNLCSCYSLLITISIIFCFVAGGIMNDVVAIIFGIILLIFIIISFLFSYWWNNKTFDDAKTNQTKESVPVIRNGVGIKNELLINGYIRQMRQQIDDKNEMESFPSDLKKLCLKFYQDLTKIDVEELVPGDIVLIKKGDAIQADMRIVEASPNFKVDQSPLTGECEPQSKNAQKSDEVPAEAENLVFFGCSCVEGEAKGLVISIGDQTFMGRTAMLATVTDMDTGDRTSMAMKRWSNRTSGCLCCISLIFFILLLTIHDIVISILWLVIGLFVITCGGLIIIFLAKSKYDLVSGLMHNSNITIKYMESVDVLSVINVLLIPTECLSPLSDENNDADAIAECKKLGIKVIMVTDDDDRNLVESMAEHVGIINPSIIHGDEIRNDDILYWNNIFSRGNNLKIIFSQITSYQKLSIIQELECRGYIVGAVGMTADDAASLKKANVGISFNNSACDVAKQAADIIVNEDKFECIVKAIKITKDMKHSIGYKLRI